MKLLGPNAGAGDLPGERCRSSRPRKRTARTMRYQAVAQFFGVINGPRGALRSWLLCKTRFRQRVAGRGVNSPGEGQ